MDELILSSNTPKTLVLLDKKPKEFIDPKNFFLFNQAVNESQQKLKQFMDKNGKSSFQLISEYIELTNTLTKLLNLFKTDDNYINPLQYTRNFFDLLFGMLSTLNAGISIPALHILLKLSRHPYECIEPIFKYQLFHQLLLLIQLENGEVTELALKCFNEFLKYFPNQEFDLEFSDKELSIITNTKRLTGINLMANVFRYVDLNENAIQTIIDFFAVKIYSFAHTDYIIPLIETLLSLSQYIHPKYMSIFSNFPILSSTLEFIKNDDMYPPMLSSYLQLLEFIINKSYPDDIEIALETSHCFTIIHFCSHDDDHVASSAFALYVQISILDYFYKDLTSFCLSIVPRLIELLDSFYEVQMKVLLSIIAMVNKFGWYVFNQGMLESFFEHVFDFIDEFDDKQLHDLYQCVQNAIDSPNEEIRKVTMNSIKTQQILDVILGSQKTNKFIIPISTLITQKCAENCY